MLAERAVGKAGRMTLSFVSGFIKIQFENATHILGK